MAAITDERMDVGIRNAIVRAGWCWAGEAVCGDAFGRPPPAVPLAPGAERWARWSSDHGSWLAAGWAIVGRAWEQQALDGGRDCPVMRLSVLLPPPDIGQPGACEEQRQHNPVHHCGHDLSPCAQSPG
jgi:hypothetical protein